MHFRRSVPLIGREGAASVGCVRRVKAISPTARHKKHGYDLLQDMQFGTQRPPCRARTRSRRRHLALGRAPVWMLVLSSVAMTGCSYVNAPRDPAGSSFSISPGPISFGSGGGVNAIDTNCTGCNSIDSRGRSVEQFTASLASGDPAPVTWSVSGGDAVSGPGIIDDEGQYMPPSYLTEDSAQVQVTASLNFDLGIRATSTLRVTPGFLQPLTPENVALGANGLVSITGFLSEAGGGGSIRFEVSNAPAGTSGGLGTLSETNCKRDSRAFTACTVTYYAPPTVAATTADYIIASAGTSSAKTSMRILLNSAGVSSNPTTHQTQLTAPLRLGSSGGNNNDYDHLKNQIVDCCSGTLGALLRASDNKRYLLSNNHVLARSDQASVGDAIVRPGLIDNNYTPSGEGSGADPVAILSGWPALRSDSTNVDAAIAQVASNNVVLSGSILEPVMNFIPVE